MVPSALTESILPDSIRSFLADILPPPLQFMAASEASAVVLIAAALAVLFIIIKTFEFAVALFNGGKLVQGLITDPAKTWREATAETAKTHHLDLLREEAAGRDAQTLQGIEDLKAQVQCLQSIVESLAAQKRSPSALERVWPQMQVVLSAAKTVALKSPYTAAIELQRAAKIVGTIDSAFAQRAYEEAKKLLPSVSWAAVRKQSKGSE